MAKLTLKSAKAAIGVGKFVEKTIKFRDVDGKEFEGEISIKVLSSAEIASITDVLNLPKDTKCTTVQYQDAMLLQSVFEGEKKPFFADLEETKQVSDEMRLAMYLAADEVINFTGKHWISMQKKSSGTNLLSTESVEEPLKKPSKE